MRVALDTFGLYDVVTLREVVRHIDRYSEGEEIYVEDVARLRPETLAIVTSETCPAAIAERELRFRFLSAVDDAREVIEVVDVRSDEDLECLLDRIEEWGA